MMTQSRNEIDQMLADSLKALGARQPIEKITIKEITDKAGVIRPTFYNHFQDKYELMEWIINKDLLDPIQPLLRNGMITEAMVLLFTNIEHDKHFYTRLAKMEGAVKFQDVVEKCVREVLLGIIREQMTGKHSVHKWLTPEWIAAYYAKSMCFAAEEWIMAGMTIPPNEMAEAYQYIITRSMTDVISEL